MAIHMFGRARHSEATCVSNGELADNARCSAVSVFASSMLLLGALGAAPSAYAGAGTITTVVQTQSANVTYSRLATTSPSRPALVTYAGWLVTVSSDQANTNTINNIRFTATARVTDPAEKATFASADGVSCVTTANPPGEANPGINDGSSIDCAIGQLRAGETFPTFAIFFTAPVKVEGNGFDNQSEDFVNLRGITYYAEGTGGPNSVPINSTNAWPTPVPIELGTCNPTQVKSGLPKTGGNFFTGGVASATCANDPFSVAVNVPNPPNISTIELFESESTTAECLAKGNFVQCFNAQVTIPAVQYAPTSNNELTIVLRVLASNIKPGTKIGNTIIYYTPDLGSPTPITRNCPTPTTPFYDGLPCIAKTIYYKNKSVPGWTPELDGAFEYQLLNDSNGGYKVF